MRDETTISSVKNVTTRINLKVRGEPKDQSTLLGIAPAGTRLIVLGERKKWFKVLFGNAIGWVFKEYVELTQKDENHKNIDKTDKIDKIDKISRIYKVFIDPGHGGKDPGAVGQKGTREKDLTLTLSKYLKEELEKLGSFAVKLSRDQDQYVDLKARGRAALHWGADIFISEHFNAAGNREAKGVEVFYSIDLPETKGKAKELSRVIAQVSRTNNRGAKVDKSSRYPGEDRITVLDITQDGGIPLVFLVENGFISNPPEEDRLRQDHVLREIAQVQAKTIYSWRETRPAAI
ncbi:N-acetylmuramoyl-L-alanine amidase [Dehalobacterium formicoaceticum]|uniref:N-acetylmuramoyl-L-alanine amidase n=1 Tax=Dehalobacterium formicoaceticum TaxID=51515 RepID=A0ABT1Y9T6_9FIRM|nr:N-acetylmuramoyl-L-alanine amidase [Dehalobacterium formicoaceticum]MCR6546416.1 N-acetylmuramoyl-L-alanine amidase [Dehalobacterium formicoaceticum]